MSLYLPVAQRQYVFLMLRGCTVTFFYKWRPFISHLTNLEVLPDWMCACYFGSLFSIILLELEDVAALCWWKETTAVVYPVSSYHTVQSVYISVCYISLHTFHCLSLTSFKSAGSLLLKWISPKMQPRLFFVNLWVKHLCTRIITTKGPLLGFTVFLFLTQTQTQWECLRQISDIINIAIFKTLRRLDTTWNSDRSITRVSTHEHKHWENCLCTQSLL